MVIPKGKKLILTKEGSKTQIEIKRHRESYMDNILIINSIGNKKYEDVWIVEKDLPVWLNSLSKEGYNQIKE